MSSPVPPTAPIAAVAAAKIEDKKPEPKPETKPAQAAKPKQEVKKDDKTVKKENEESKKENKEPNKKEAKPPSTVTSPSGKNSPSGKSSPNGKNSPLPESNGEPGAMGTPLTFREVFRAFSKFGDTKSDGKLLTLSQSDKWMKQAKVIDGKTITTTDTAIHFKKFKMMKVGIQDYEKYLQDLGKAKKIDVDKIKNQLRDSGPPVAKGTKAKSFSFTNKRPERR